MRKVTQIALAGAKTRLTIAAFMILVMAAGFLLLLANDSLAIALNEHIMLRNFDGFALQVLFTAGIFALVHGMNTFGSYLRSSFQAETLLRIPRHYIARMLQARHDFFTKRSTAELHTTMWTASQASAGFYDMILLTISRMVLFVFYGVVVFRLDMWAGIFTIAAAPLFFLLTAGLGKWIASMQHEWVEYNGELSTVTQETFENAANAKAKGAQGFFVQRSVGILRKIKKIWIRLDTAEAYIANIGRLINILAPLLIIFLAMRFSPTFEGTIGAITVLYINIPLFLGGVADIHRGLFIHYKLVKPFLEKLQEFDNIETESEEGRDIVSFESLRTDAVKVTFEGGRVIAVPDFEIKKGEKLMFFGESGIGKSTVFNIIMGFQEYEGAVFINGINLREISLSSLRKVFGITFQHTNALTLDLSGNILLGAEKSDDELVRLLQLCALEGQHETKGDDILNNKVLSGGEKSRIGLAQMLVSRPEIMLIDEAFSNMDEELESKIIADLFRQYPDCAVICISHRSSSKPFFDRVVEF